MRQIRFWVGLILSIPMALMGQGIEATARLDTQQVRIGEPLRYTLEVRQDPSFRVSWPAWSDTLGQMEVIQKDAIDTSMLAGQLVQRQTLTLMAFDSGLFRIPGVEVQYLAAGRGGVRRVMAPGFTVPVTMVPVDTAADIMDIKDIKREPITLGEILFYGGIGLLAVGLVVGIIWVVRRRRKQEAIIPVRAKPPVPPHEIAMRRLSQLEEQRLWQQGKVKQYYVDLTDILRSYLEGRYGIRALESVTDEILLALRPKGIPDKQLSDLAALLPMADLAKFARSLPSEKENLDAMETAREFIRNTLIEKELEPEALPTSPDTSAS